MRRQRYLHFTRTLSKCYTFLHKRSSSTFSSVRNSLAQKIVEVMAKQNAVFCSPKNTVEDEDCQRRKKSYVSSIMSFSLCVVIKFTPKKHTSGKLAVKNVFESPQICAMSKSSVLGNDHEFGLTIWAMWVLIWVCAPVPLSPIQGPTRAEKVKFMVMVVCDCLSLIKYMVLT